MLYGIGKATPTSAHVQMIAPTQQTVAQEDEQANQIQIPSEKT